MVVQVMLNGFNILVAGYLSFQEKKYSSTLPSQTSSQIPLAAFSWVLGVLTKRAEALPENVSHPHTASVQEPILFMKFSLISSPLCQNPNEM